MVLKHNIQCTPRDESSSGPQFCSTIFVCIHRVVPFASFEGGNKSIFISSNSTPPLQCPHPLCLKPLYEGYMSSIIFELFTSSLVLPFSPPSGLFSSLHIISMSQGVSKITSSQSQSCPLSSFHFHFITSCRT